MEIEAKFTLGDEATFESMSRLVKLGDFDLEHGNSTGILDRYYDTKDLALLAAGWSCRDRTAGDARILAVKSMGGSGGAIHRRVELEVRIPPEREPGGISVADLPGVLGEIVGGQPLVPVLEIAQERTVRYVRREGRKLAEMALDRVELRCGERPAAWLDLEFELCRGEPEEALKEIVRRVRRGWGLESQPLSKYARALEHIAAGAEGKSIFVPGERAACARIALRADGVGRRARFLLAVDAGLGTDAAAGTAGMSGRQARWWIGAWRMRRMGIFPARAREVARDVPPSAAAPGKFGLGPEDSTVEAAGKVILHHAGCLALLEAGVRAGNDPEEVHDLRVCLRRMTAALALFSRAVGEGKAKSLRRRIDRAGLPLGAVRDLDVLIAGTEGFRESLAGEPTGRLDGFLAECRRRREVRRGKMLRSLDAARFAGLEKLSALDLGGEAPEKLKARGEGRDGRGVPGGREGHGGRVVHGGQEGLGVLGGREGRDGYKERGGLKGRRGRKVPRAGRVRDSVPVLSYRLYMKARALKERVGEPGASVARLHLLRVRVKDLRYALESFEDLLGPGAAVLVERCRQVQDILGGIQDATVARKELRKWMEGEKKGAASREAGIGAEAPGDGTAGDQGAPDLPEGGAVDAIDAPAGFSVVPEVPVTAGLGAEVPVPAGLGAESPVCPGSVPEASASPGSAAGTLAGDYSGTGTPVSAGVAADTPTGPRIAEDRSVESYLAHLDTMKRELFAQLHPALESLFGADSGSRLAAMVGPL